MAIAFDLSSVPQNYTINEAVMKIYKYGNYQAYNKRNTYNLYRITKAWEESGANWTKATNSSNWSKAGGDYTNTVIDSYEWDGNSNGWFDFTVTDAVKDMVANPSTDFGFLVSLNDLNPGSNSEAHNNESYFHSSEADNDALKPRLVIKGSGNVPIVLKQNVPDLFQHTITNNTLSLYFTGKSSDIYTVTITNISGKTLLTKDVYQRESRITLPLHFSAGLYCVTVSVNGMRQVKNILLY